jgi:hypothetical protein
MSKIPIHSGLGSPYPTQIFPTPGRLDGTRKTLAHREATAEPRREVGCGKSQELLVGVEAPAEFGGEGPSD